jgi:signal transduction histidine kinase
MGLHDVVRALAMIEENGHMDKFVRAAKRNEALVTVDAKTVNFVKDFVVQNKMHSNPVGKHIVNAATGAGGRPRMAATMATRVAPGDYTCHFGRGRD